MLTNNAALKGTLTWVCRYPRESLAVMRLLHQMVEQGHIKGSWGCLNENKDVRYTVIEVRYKNVMKHELFHNAIWLHLVTLTGVDDDIVKINVKIVLLSDFYRYTPNHLNNEKYYSVCLFFSDLPSLYIATVIMFIDFALFLWCL